MNDELHHNNDDNNGSEVSSKVNIWCSQMIADMVARAIWKGTVSFRLVNIPIVFDFHFIIQAAKDQVSIDLGGKNVRRI
jgi:hypothetical protein